MRISILVMIAALMALVALPAAAGILNGDCELGTWGGWTSTATGRLTSWTMQGLGSQNTGNWTYGITTTQGVHGGTYALGSTLKATGKEIRLYQTITADVIAGQSYTLKAWMKHAQGSTGGGWIRLKAAGVGGGSGLTSGLQIQSTTYTQDAVTVTAGPGGIEVAIHIMSGGAGAATVAQGQFDDVTIPEPGSMIALMSGLVGLVGFAVRRRK